jgi:hypothetical protein
MASSTKLVTGDLFEASDCEEPFDRLKEQNGWGNEMI